MRIQVGRALGNSCIETKRFIIVRPKVILLKVLDDLHCDDIKMASVQTCACDKRSFCLTFDRSRPTWRLK